jgi:hypothetical protein
VKRILLLFLLIASFQPLRAQEKGILSGVFQANANFYQYDPKIGTYTTQYLHQLSSAESWLYLNYRVQGYNFALRYDLFNNSALPNPQEAYSKQGIGFFQVSKDIEKLNITAGSFYDQFGSGIIFRAYEDRTIGLDYAIQGIRAKYTFNDSFFVKAFTGVQKYRLDVHPQIIKGINTEKIWGFGKFLGFVTGAAAINRTLDDNTVNQLAERINALPLDQRFNPKYNMYAFSVYNTIRSGDFSLYTEYAYKTPEAVYLEEGFSNYVLKNKDGNVFYAGLNYSHPGIGINLQYKRVNTFIMRTSPDDRLQVGLINFLPPLSKQHAFRLPARYGISAREQGEEGYQAEVVYSPAEHSTFNFNTTLINNPNRAFKNHQLYREYYGDFTRRFNRRLRAVMGLQYIEYAQQEYQGKAGAAIVKALTPLAEVSLKIDKRMRKSLRFEGQYLMTKQDYGDFAYGLLEFNWAPHWSLSISDMVNVRPVKSTEIVHYYTLFGSYTHKTTRFTAGYIKQVEGVVCTGGVCRVEPAFSGFKFGLSTNF